MKFIWILQVREAFDPQRLTPVMDVIHLIGAELPEKCPELVGLPVNFNEEYYVPARLALLRDAGTANDYPHVSMKHDNGEYYAILGLPIS